MNKFLVIIVGIFLVSCTPNSNLLEDASWLNGNWKREYNDVTQIEKWQHTESGFTGQSIVVVTDTTLMHTLDIRNTDNNWELTKHEAEVDMDFTFVLLSSNADSMVFRNTENVWPQTITYKKINANEMELIIDGQDGTMNKNAAFIFERY